MDSFAVVSLGIQQHGLELVSLPPRSICFTLLLQAFFFFSSSIVVLLKISSNTLHKIYVLYFSPTDFKSKFEVERKDTDGYNSSTMAGPQQQHPPPLLPLHTPLHPFSSSSAGVSGAGGVPGATPAHLPDSTTDSWSGYYGARQEGVCKPFSSKSASLKQRCRDYDGRNTFNHLYLISLAFFFFTCYSPAVLEFFFLCI